MVVLLHYIYLKDCAYLRNQVLCCLLRPSKYLQVILTPLHAMGRYSVAVKLTVNRCQIYQSCAKYTRQVFEFWHCRNYCYCATYGITLLRETWRVDFTLPLFSKWENDSHKRQEPRSQVKSNFFVKVMRILIDDFNN